MQRAAKAVALENQRLRDLLASCGVSRGEVDTYLASFTSVQGGSSSQNQSTSTTVEQLQSGYRVTNDTIGDHDSHHSSSLCGHIGPMHGGLRSTVPSSTRSTSTTGTVDVCADNTKADHTQAAGRIFHKPQQADRIQISNLLCNDDQDQEDPRKLLPDVSDCFCPPLSQAPEAPGSARTLETPCEKAATILAEVRGHDDPSRARAALGCVGTDSCLVKNTRLFQLMEENS
jgi:hypothetical protein